MISRKASSHWPAEEHQPHCYLYMSSGISTFSTVLAKATRKMCTSFPNLTVPRAGTGCLFCWLVGQLNSYAEHCSAGGSQAFGIRFGGPLVDILPELAPHLGCSRRTSLVAFLEQGSHHRPFLEREIEALKQLSDPCQLGKEQNPKGSLAYSCCLPLSNAISVYVPPLCRQL